MKDRTVSVVLFNRLHDIINQFEEVDYETQNGWNRVGEIEDSLRKWQCDATGGHDFIFDQCGYWQHQYCVACRESKYPDLAVKTCQELINKMGDTTEQDFNKEEPK